MRGYSTTRRDCWTEFGGVYEETAMDELLERRVWRERRVRDVGPPSGHADRRRATERRIPSITDSTISDDEWRQLFAVHAGEDSRA